MTNTSNTYFLTTTKAYAMMYLATRVEFLARRQIRMAERQMLINRSRRLAESARRGDIMDKHGVVGCTLPCSICN